MEEMNTSFSDDSSENMMNDIDMISGKKRERTDGTDEPDQPVRKRRVVLDMTNDPTIAVAKKKRVNHKADLRTEILAKYNSSVGDSERVKKFNALDPYTIFVSYSETQTGCVHGPQYKVFQDVLADFFKKSNETMNKSRAYKSDLTIPSLDNRDAIIATCARHFIDKHCTDGGSGRLFVNQIQFALLQEEVKSEVLIMLQSRDVRGVEALEKFVHTPKFVRNLYESASELRRNGVRDVTLVYDLNGLPK